MLLYDAITELKDKDFLPFLKKQLKIAKKINNFEPILIKELNYCIKSLNKL
jgi:hypothetical protein